MALALLALVALEGQASAQDDAAAEIVGGVIILLVLLPLYVAPALIAIIREHPNRWAILVANLLLGVTGIGWIGCLIWSLTAVRPIWRHNTNGGSASSFAHDDIQRAFWTAPSSELRFEDLSRLKDLVDKGAINQDEYESLKLRFLQEFKG